MSFDRKLVVEILAKLGTYVADLGTVATTTEVTAARVETSRSKIVAAAEQIAAGQSDMAATAVRATAAVGPLGAAMAAGAVVAGAFAVAHHKVAQETTNMVKALALSGNQAGVNTGQMHDMAEAVQGVGKTHAQAVGVLTEFAASGKVSATMMESLTATTLEAQRTLGLSADETVKRFASLADEPVKASLKLAESANHLTASTYARIKSLEEMGRKDLAAAEAQKAYQVQLDEASARVNERLGTVQKAWRGAGEMAAWAWDRFLDLGREQTSGEKLGAVAAEIRNLEAQIALRGSTTGGTRFDRETLALKEQLLQLREKQGLLQDDARLNQRIATAKAEQAAQVQAMGEWDKKGEQYLTKQAKMEAEIAAERRLGVAAKKSEHDIEERIAAIRAKYADKAGGKKDSYVELADAGKAYARVMDEITKSEVESAAHTEQYTKTQKTLLAWYSSPAFLSMPDTWKAEVVAKAEAQIATEKLAEADKLHAKEMEQARKAAAAYGKQLDDIALAGMDLIAQANERTAAVEEMVAATEFEASLMGRTNSERAVALKQYQIELDLKRQIAKINESIASQEDKDYAINAAKNAANRAKANAAAEVVNAEFERVSQQIEQSLTDALMRGFENGKDFAVNLRDTVANMFKTLVLRPIVSAIVNPVAGAITGGLGLAGKANAATGAGNLMGAGAGLYNSFATSSVGGSLGLSVPYVDVLGAGAAEAGIMTSAGSSLGAALPWIGGGLAVLSLLKSLDDSGTYHTGGLGSYSTAGGTAVGDAVKGQGLGFDLAAKDYTASSQQAAAALAQSVVGMLDSTANTFGQQVGYYAATAFADDTSKDGAWGALMLKLGDKVLIDWQQGADKWPGREFSDGEAGAKEYAAAIAVAVRDQLITQVPDWADATLQALGDAPTLDQLGAVVTQINAAAAAMAGMGQASAAFAGLSETATAALIKALGGAEAAASGLDIYYQNYYSEAERAAVVTANLAAELAAFGVQLPSTRAQWREMTDAALAAGNTDLAAKLVQLSGAFASVTDAVQTTATAVAGIADGIRQAITTAYTGARTSAMSALQSAVARERSVMQTSAHAASTLVGEVQNVFDTLADAVQGLRADAGGLPAAQQGASFISAALAQAQATGVLPEQQALADAINAARGGLGANSFASLAEQQFAQLKLAGELEGLQTISGSQLTAAQYQLQVAEDQLRALDDTLDYWQQQVSAAEGNVTATLSVGAAIRSLQVALSQSLDAGFTSISGLGQKTLQDQLQNVATQYSPGTTGGAVSQLAASIAGGTIGLYDAVAYLSGAPTTSASYTQHVTDGGATPEAFYAMLRTNIDTLIAQGLAGAELSQTLIDYGVSLTDASVAYGITAAEVAANLLKAGATTLPQLAVGTNFVPQDMVAQLHRGEAVVPKAYNPWANGGAAGMGNTQQLERLVQGLTAEVQRLQALVGEGNRYARDTAATLDQVTEGGGAMRTMAA